MFDVKLIRWHVVWLVAQCLFPIGLFRWFIAWLVGRLIWFSFYSTIATYHFDWHISAFKPRFHIRTLVDRLHANIMALVRQDLQTKVTDAFAHLNTRAPIARKETVGKKAFFIWWNTFMKNSTWPFKLSIDETNCKSYSASHSFVCYLCVCFQDAIRLKYSSSNCYTYQETWPHDPYPKGDPLASCPSLYSL